MRFSAGIALLCFACGAPLIAAAAARDDTAEVDAVADDYYAAVLAEQPENAYFAGVAPERHDRLTDRSPEAERRWQRREDGWLARLTAIDPHDLLGTPQWITHGVLTEQLEAQRGLRVCHLAWWYGVNHMESWHLTLATVAAAQPVATAVERRAALERWSHVPDLIRQEIANLRSGLAHGYSAARPVAERMLAQIDGLITTDLTDHPYDSPAARSGDPAFAEAYRRILAGDVMAALREFRTFLADTYLKAARDPLAVTSLPDGAACYAAFLRAYTTLDRSAADTRALGERVVAENRAVASELGRRLFGKDDLSAIVDALHEAPDNRYADTDALLAASRALVERAGAAMSSVVERVPEQGVVVEPIPAYEDGAGASSHYEPPRADGTPGTYRISLLAPGGTTRSEAEITAFHETWPGHHLQLAYAQRVAGLNPANRLVFNSGYVEGWARYAESLAEELGLYDTDYAKIQRRAWPARGMVVDPGIHAFGWTRERAVEFMMESGRSRAAAISLVDRIAAIPGQLTAYDSGAQEIFALRREAEAELGTDFDLKAFHEAVLGHGTVPLALLRTQVERWIKTRRTEP